MHGMGIIAQAGGIIGKREGKRDIVACVRKGPADAVGVANRGTFHLGNALGELMHGIHDFTAIRLITCILQPDEANLMKLTRRG